jgi:hypothetical protein
MMKALCVGGPCSGETFEKNQPFFRVIHKTSRNFVPSDSASGVRAILEPSTVYHFVPGIAEITDFWVPEYAVPRNSPDWERRAGLWAIWQVLNTYKAKARA